ncbi:MAG: tRNA lysidine(34) synthetase TilS [Ignavibacteriae bacterium]|nr:tRNA lysidine(34) synthetase TilS [Ignavibacteriota bacterium]
MKAKIYETVINFIKKHNLIENNSKLLIALSGGPDSVFALHFFHQFKNKYKAELIAAHVNHNLRGNDSEQDQIFCEKICSELKIPIFIKSVEVEKFARKNNQSVEEAARNLRYNFFEEISNQEKVDYIITAHNSDDNTETILLNLIKGTGLSGLSGIPVKRGKIVRPILSLSKKEIVEFLELNKINFRIDKSNYENDFERNKLRNIVIPEIEKINPSLNSTLRKFSNNISSINIFIQQETEKVFKKFVKKNENQFIVNQKLFQRENVLISSLIIKKLFEDHLKISFTSKDSDKVKNLVSQQKGTTIKLKNSVKVIREDESLIFFTEEKLFTDEIEIRLNSSQEIGNYEISIEEVNEFNENSNFSEIISGDKTEDIFILRRWKIGDKFIPLGMKNFKKISDFLTDKKVKSSSKKNHLILTNRNEIVYVFGLRIDERYKLTKNTKRKIGICLRKKNKN